MIEAAHMAVPDLLFINLKTSGIYLKGESIDSPQQPWAPYLAILQCNRSGQVVNHFSAYIQPAGRMVKQSATQQHGIDHKAGARLGVPESRALGFLTDMLKVGPFESYQRVVTFGDMDPMVISSLLARFAISLKRPSNSFDRLWLRRPLTEFMDLQKPYAQQICKLPSEFPESGDFKWPSFREASSKLLGREPSALRDSLEDLLILKDMYFELKSRGFFTDREAA